MNKLEAIVHAGNAAYSAKGRIIARAKADGTIDDGKTRVSGKKDTKRTIGYVSVTERNIASGCSEADKDALATAKAADVLLKAAGLTHWPRKDEIPTGHPDEEKANALNAAVNIREAEIATLTEKLEMLRASNETLEAQVAELKAALEASTARPAKGAKGAKGAKASA